MMMFVIVALTLLSPIGLSAHSTDLFTIPTVATYPIDSFHELEMTDQAIQRIYFIRHGESEFNKPLPSGIRITSGKSLNAKLTDVGELQATELAKKISEKINSNEKFVIVSSTALRSQETARLFFENLKTSHPKAILGPSYEGFCELGLGEWEGKPKDKVYEQALEPWEKLSQFKKFTTDKVIGGESFKSVAQRALKELHKLSQDYPEQTIFVVSHFNTMNAMAFELNDQVHMLSDDESKDLPYLIFDNCDLLEIEISNKEKPQHATVKMHIQTGV